MSQTNIENKNKSNKIKLDFKNSKYSTGREKNPLLKFG